MRPELPEETNRAMKAHYLRMHCLRLRLRGLSYKRVGELAGVSAGHAAQMCQKCYRIIRGIQEDRVIDLKRRIKTLEHEIRVLSNRPGFFYRGDVNEGDCPIWPDTFSPSTHAVIATLNCSRVIDLLWLTRERYLKTEGGTAEGFREILTFLKKQGFTPITEAEEKRCA